MPIDVSALVTMVEIIRREGQAQSVLDMINASLSEEQRAILASYYAYALTAEAARERVLAKAVGGK